jgi:hypothetical protein
MKTKQILSLVSCCLLLVSTSGCASLLADLFQGPYTAGYEYKDGHSHFKVAPSSWSEEEQED